MIHNFNHSQKTTNKYGPQYRMLAALLALLVYLLVLLFLRFETASAATCPTLPTTYGTVNLTANVPSTTTYTVWTRMMAADTTNNSYYLQVDSGCGILVGNSSSISSSAWSWINYRDGTSTAVITMSLSQGSHTLKLTGAEPNVKIDEILFAPAGCSPSGLSASCSSTPGTTTPPPPSGTTTKSTGGTSTSSTPSTTKSGTTGSSSSGSSSASGTTGQSATGQTASNSPGAGKGVVVTVPGGTITTKRVSDAKLAGWTATGVAVAALLFAAYYFRGLIFKPAAPAKPDLESPTTIIMPTEPIPHDK